jgi:hypothetical protein
MSVATPVMVYAAPETLGEASAFQLAGATLGSLLSTGMLHGLTRPYVTRIEVEKKPLLTFDTRVSLTTLSWMGQDVQHEHTLKQFKLLGRPYLNLVTSTRKYWLDVRNDLRDKPALEYLHRVLDYWRKNPPS